MPMPMPMPTTAMSSSCPVDVVLSLRREKTARLLRTMRPYHMLPALSHSWGSAPAYMSLLRRPDGLAVLDVSEDGGTDRLEQRVRVLSTISSVVVLAPRDVDVVATLRAGAVNVLPRDTPPRELAGRIVAERRWIDLSSRRQRLRAPSQSRPQVVPHQASQQVLLELLSLPSREWCCHDLGLLLGTAGEPVSKRALQARVMRLNGRLAPYGVSVDAVHRWGRTRYSGVREAVPYEVPPAQSPLRL